MVRLRGGGVPGPDVLSALAAPATVAVEYFTDPACCWSWALEPAWRRLRARLGARVRWRTRMAGMIPDWSSFADPLNDVALPAHMGPYWLHVRRQCGVPLAHAVWATDPPMSTFPACIAVHAALMQSEAAGEAYLRRVREALVLDGRDIGRREVLEEVAAAFANEGREPFDAVAFSRALDDGRAARAFEDDLREARFRRIGRFPSIVITPRAGRRLLLTGFRPLAVLEAAIAHAVGEPLPPSDDADGSPAAWVGRWGRATCWELQAVSGLDALDVHRALDAEVAAGRLALVEHPAAGEVSWVVAR